MSISAMLHVLTILAAYSGKLTAHCFFARVLQALCVTEKHFSFVHFSKFLMETTHQN